VVYKYGKAIKVTEIDNYEKCKFMAAVIILGYTEKLDPPEA
jgi:hypothetical protein